jgi:hypothetical protein
LCSLILEKHKDAFQTTVLYSAEWLIGRDVEGSGLGLVEGSEPTLALGKIKTRKQHSQSMGRFLYITVELHVSVM